MDTKKNEWFGLRKSETCLDRDNIQGKVTGKEKELLLIS